MSSRPVRPKSVEDSIRLLVERGTAVDLGTVFGRDPSTAVCDPLLARCCRSGLAPHSDRRRVLAVRPFVARCDHSRDRLAEELGVEPLRACCARRSRGRCLPDPGFRRRSVRPAGGACVVRHRGSRESTNSHCALRSLVTRARSRRSARALPGRRRREESEASANMKRARLRPRARFGLGEPAAAPAQSRVSLTRTTC
jgi:hypothetical protein